MTSRVEIDLPNGNESLRFGELANFVDHARNAGATSDTPVVAVAADQDPEMLMALRVELDELSGGRGDMSVAREDVVSVIRLLEAIEHNEGDARIHLGAIGELRKRLADIALGA